MEHPLSYWTAVLIFVFTPVAFGGVIRVAFDNKSYEVNLTKDSVAFNEPGFSKKIMKQKCNRALIEQFASDLKANKTYLAEVKKDVLPKGAIKVSFDGKTKFALRYMDEGKYFYDLPSKVKNLWLTSERICSR